MLSTTTGETPTLPASQFSITTHNGTITLYNRRTDGHRTFRVRTQPDHAKFAPCKRIVSLLTGPNNEADYTGFAFVASDGKLRLWKSKQGKPWTIYADMLTRPDYWQSCGVAYQWCERCRKCNRSLTDPTSIELGIGPKCRGE